jgi:dihydroorotase
LEILKKRPSNISVGVTPHHLLFDIESVQGRQTFFKVNPPIRTSLDREALWSGINKGIINIIESDHAPHTLEEKEESFDAAPCGMPGVETMYPLFLALAKQERISFDRVIKLICENPSKLTRIQKGKIEIGRDADLAIFDHKDLRVIKGDNLHSKCGWSAFEGKKALFPKHVFLRGEIIIEDRELKVNPGFGKCLHKPI